MWIEEAPRKIWTLFDSLVSVCDGLNHWSHISLINAFQVHLSTVSLWAWPVLAAVTQRLKCSCTVSLPSCPTAVARTLYSSNTLARVLCHPLKKWPMERSPTTNPQTYSLKQHFSSWPVSVTINDYFLKTLNFAVICHTAALHSWPI